MAEEIRRDVATQGPLDRLSALLYHDTPPWIEGEIPPLGAVAVVEEQDLVYLPERRAIDAAVPARAVDVPEPLTSRRMIADPPLLLRISALTFNAHRIHYDRDCACSVEYYPGLVVHGPLLAMLLVDHALRATPGARVTDFSFRARVPVIAGEAFDLNGANDALWVRTEGKVAMMAQIGFA